MTLALNPLPCPDSPLRRLDPRWKLAALLLAAGAVASLRSLPAAALGLAGALALALLARLPGRWYMMRLGATAVFLAPFVLTLPFLLRDRGTSPALGLWHVPYGLAVALLLSAKALTIVTLLLVLLATAPLESTLKAAHSLRLPGLLVHLALLTYRYLFVIASELGRLRVALRVRGYRNRATRHSYRTVGHVAGTLLARSAERAERVGQAMRCRGFDGRFRSLSGFRTRPADVLAFLLVAGAAASLLVWDFWSA
jgi:cobalt/nickel transport system permease protein